MRAAGCVLALSAAALVWPGPGCAAVAGPCDLAAQGVMDRTPNLSGGWVGSTGQMHFNFLHRFWISPGSPDDKLVNSPTMLLAFPLPGRTLLGAQFATNSLVAPGRFNEWELFGRWAPPLPADLPLDAAITGGFNSAASSVDGELALGLSLAPVRLLAAARAFSDVARSGESGWGGAAGAVLRVSDGVAVAGDLGRVEVDGAQGRTVWGAGLQLRIPTTPHTFSLQVTNTRTGTLHGSSLRDRARSGPFWGFEFTIPVTFARYVPRLRGGGGDAAAPGTTPGPAEPVPDAPPGTRTGTVEVTMTDDLRFVPDTLRIQVGDTVVWRNTTPLLHTVTAHPERVRDPEQVRLPDGAEPFDSGNMFEGNEFRHVFTVAGEYRYVCVPHDVAGMFGWVVVEPEGGTRP